MTTYRVQWQLPTLSLSLSFPPSISTDDIQLKHCSHALALYYVAGEEGAASASETGKGLVAPGTLRQLFVDALNYLDERTVQQKAEMFAYSEGMKKQPYTHQ